MKKYFGLVLMLLVTFSQVEGRRPKEGTNDEQEIKKVLEEYRKAILTNDVSAMDRIEAPDFTITTPNGVYRNKALQLSQAPSNQFEFINWDDIKIRMYGNVAVVTFHANVLFHVVNDRHLRKRPMIFTTNKPLNEWGKVLHDEDMAAAILDRVLERGRFIHLEGPSGRTRHLNLEEILPVSADRARISGINVPEFPEPTNHFYE